MHLFGKFSNCIYLEKSKKRKKRKLQNLWERKLLMIGFMFLVTIRQLTHFQYLKIFNAIQGKLVY